MQSNNRTARLCAFTAILDQLSEGEINEFIAVAQQLSELLRREREQGKVPFKNLRMALIRSGITHKALARCLCTSEREVCAKLDGNAKILIGEITVFAELLAHRYSFNHLFKEAL